MVRRTAPTEDRPCEAAAEAALREVETARTELAALRAAGAPLPQRRAAWRRLSRAFLAADAPLRALTAAAKAAPYGKESYLRWAHWRHRLSRLDLERQHYLFAQSDDLPVLEPGSVRALDSGMSGPSIGELQHGGSVPAGTVPTYGQDLAVTMRLTEEHRPGPAPGYRLMTPAARPRLVPRPVHRLSVATGAPTPARPASTPTAAPASALPTPTPGRTPTLPDAA